MKTLSAIALAFLFALTASAATGHLGPYIYGYDSSPVNAPVNSIDPTPGSIVINNATGDRYLKIGASGTNATYTTNSIIFDSGTVTLSGTATQTFTVGTLPATSHSFIYTGGEFLITSATGANTAAATYVVQSGSGNSLTATITSGTALNSVTALTAATTSYVGITGTAKNLELRTVTTGTFDGPASARILLHGYFLP